MPAERTKELCVMVKDKLKEAIEKLDQFLNYTAVPQLLEEFLPATAEQEEYVRECLRDLRHLSVACELDYEKVSLVLRRAKFNQEHAEKVLSEIVHSSVSMFYQPNHEVYMEDGRYSYTWGDAITFRKTPPVSLSQLILSLSKVFGKLRDELDYYGTDYMARNHLQSR